MKIVKFTAENIKRLRAVSIDPKGSIVEISGPNGAGKSSILDAIFWTLAGTREMQKQPVRHGASEGKTEIDLGDMIVRRKFSQTGSTLSIERKKDGARLPKPQEVLDKLYGRIGFDPLAFSRMKPKDQFEQLRKLVKIDVDIDNLDLLNKSDFAKRAELNRDAKALQAQADGMVVDAKLPEAKIDISELSRNVEQAANHNNEIVIERSRRAAEEKELHLQEDVVGKNDTAIKGLREEIKKLEQRISNIEADSERRRSKIVSIRAAQLNLPPLPEPIDVSEVRAQLDQAVALNSAIDKRERKFELVKQSEAKRVEAENLTEQMESRTRSKMDAIAAAKFPVEGLGFGSDEVLLGGVPFEQASTAEQLRASCAIAMAMNPELRVIIIRDGSLLDDNSMAILESMARDKDYQVWIEVVDTSGTVGICIEDGMVVADNQNTEGEQSRPPTGS